MRRLHDAGRHVLADKPWMTSPQAIGEIRDVMRGGPLAVEIMTGRHEITSILVQRLVRDREVFGTFATDAPAIRVAGVHHLEKTVNGVPLRRPVWYFDVRVQGNGIADTPTHLVDQAQWLTAATGEPIELLDARLSATRVPLALFRRVTGADAFPPELRPLVTGDALDYFSNTELRLRVRGVEVELASRWDLSVPPGGGDTHKATIAGSRSIVRVEQGPETKFRRRVFVEPRDGVSGVDTALRSAVTTWQRDYTGVSATAAPRGFEIEIPATLRTGHESHFPLVLDELLRAIDGEARPPDRGVNTLAKYDLLARALAKT
jgi:predicted dehydrogenase